MTWITSPATKLLAILTAVKDAGHVKAVYDQEEAELTTYPCATLYYDGFSGDLFDTAANIRDIRFRVRIYVKNTDKSVAESDMRSAVQEVVNAIDEDPTLTGTVITTFCREGTRDEGTREMEVSYQNIEVTVRVRVNR